MRCGAARSVRENENPAPNAFQHGKFLAPVQAIVTTADPLISIGLGVLWLGVALRGGPAQIAWEIVSLLVMTSGIVVTARFARPPATMPAAQSSRLGTPGEKDPSIAADRSDDRR